MNELKDLVQYALDQDYNKASEVFGNAMSIKIQDVLDQEKVKLANQIYNGVDESDEEDEELAAMSDEEIDTELEGAEELDDEDVEVEEDEEDEEK